MKRFDQGVPAQSLFSHPDDEMIPFVLSALNMYEYIAELPLLAL